MLLKVEFCKSITYCIEIEIICLCLLGEKTWYLRPILRNRLISIPNYSSI